MPRRVVYARLRYYSQRRAMVAASWQREEEEEEGWKGRVAPAVVCEAGTYTQLSRDVVRDAISAGSLWTITDDD